MANLLDWNTLEHRLAAFLDPENGIDKPQKAFPILMVATILGISEEDASDAITDGAKDRGVDAIVVDENHGNVVHIFQFKCADKFENAKKNFPSSEIDKLATYIAEMLDMDATLKQTCNPILWNKTQEIWEAMNKPGVEFKIHFCGNMLEMTADEKARASAVFRKYRQFTIQHYSLDSIVKLFLDNNKPKVDFTLTAVDKDYFDRTDGNVRGLICSVEAGEIIRMVTSPEDALKVREEIFNDNVRVYLSSSNKINKKIIESALSEDKSLFWYLNNGITITCDSFSYLKGRRAPQIELKNVQIVNGGQTSHALFEAAQQKTADLSDVLVLVRIIETKSEAFSLSIAESTNSQTPIKGRDLRSNDEIQKRIESGFAAVDYFYERKQNQWSDKPKARRIDAFECGQAFAAYHLGKPEIAKKDRGRIYSDLYDTVFTEDLTINELLCSFLLLREIDKLKKTVQSAIRNGSLDDPQEIFLIDGAFHVLYTVRLLAAKKNLDPSDFPTVKKQIRPAINLVKKIVSDKMSNDETFSFNRFFKDSETSKLIFAAI
ncbi:AIPR family protein [Duganella sp. BuS-21]|uniref:AIPR family protein n=1 Tax=Duganella sp. BuS-21 TaxID=2943848 RepID=UPI0035A60301